MSEQQKGTHMPLWLTGVMVTGLAALLLAGVVFWTLLSAPQSLVGAEPPATVLAFGRWAWHLLHLVAAWL